MGKYNSNNKIKMAGTIIPESNEFIYLGLPIGNNLFKNKFLEAKMGKVEKAFYSLYGIGCKPHALTPRTIAFLYKQFCQSIFRYGLDNLYVNNKQIDSFNIRQNILIKRAIGISKFCKTTPLFQVLKIESMEQLYAKHKIFCYRQIKNNQMTSEILNYLRQHYENNVISEHSFVKQLRKVDEQINSTDCCSNTKDSIKKIEQLYKCENTGLTDSLKFIIEYKSYIELIKQLELILNYKNYLKNHVQAPVLSENNIYSDFDLGRVFSLGDSADGDNYLVLTPGNLT